jgi:3-hydroxybutyryl-CoA dehydratase
MHKGDIFQHTFKLSDRVYAGFIDLFQDTNPLHTQKSFARDKGFPDVVMHGNILNGFLSFFVGELLPTKDVLIVSQTINFRKPVFLNDSLSFTASIQEIHESVSLVDFKYMFTNEQSIKVATGTVLIKLLK